MTDENNSGPSKTLCDLGLNKVVPKLYEDALGPASKEIGKGLETIAKSVNIALAPLAAMVWGYDKIKEHIEATLSKKLLKVSPDNIITPKPNIAGPILESLRFVGYESELRELFSNLLATSMNKSVCSSAHPSFVEVIKQLTPDEARIINYFIKNELFPIILRGGRIDEDLENIDEQEEENIGNVKNSGYVSLKEKFIDLCNKVDLNSKELILGYKDNLERLKIIRHLIYNQIKLTKGLQEEFKLEFIDNHFIHRLRRGDFKKYIEDSEIRLSTKHREIIHFTTFGELFVMSCISTD